MKPLPKIAVAVALASLLAEGACRLMAPRLLDRRPGEGEDIAQPERLLALYPHLAIGYTLVPRARVRFKGKTFTTNSLGFRGREVGAKERFRILGLGDSVMMGWGVADDETYLRRLESLLGQRGYAAQTINLGVMAYNTTQEYFLLKEVGLALKPDLVLVHYVGNDFERMVFQIEAMPWNSPSYLINLVQYAWLTRSGGGGQGRRLSWRPVKDPGEFHDNFWWSLERLYGLCQREKVPLLLVLDSRYISQAAKHSDIVRYSEERGVRTVNLFKVYRELSEDVPIKDAVSMKDEHNLKYLLELGMKRDNHPNARWHQDTAALLVDEVVQQMAALEHDSPPAPRPGHGAAQ